jgi:hypothetical protein
MRRTAYAVLGWLVWQIGSRVAKRKLVQNRGKLGVGLRPRQDDSRET